jgi:hypothetical protein
VKSEQVKKVFLIKSEKSEITVLPQPVSLGREVAVDNIALVILEAPWRDNQDIPFPDPDPLFDLPFDPAHAGNPVIAADADMVCPHHQVCKSELFIGPFFGQANANNRCSVRIYCVWISIIFIIGSNSGNSVIVYL